jgi:uncharacterized protein with FMN-binding domain
MLSGMAKRRKYAQKDAKSGSYAGSKAGRMSGIHLHVGNRVQGKIANKIKPLHVNPDRITANVTTCKVQGILALIVSKTWI